MSNYITTDGCGGCSSVGDLGLLSARGNLLFYGVLAFLGYHFFWKGGSHSRESYVSTAGHVGGRIKSAAARQWAKRKSRKNPGKRHRKGVKHRTKHRVGSAKRAARKRAARKAAKTRASRKRSGYYKRYKRRFGKRR